MRSRGLSMRRDGGGEGGRERGRKRGRYRYRRCNEWQLLLRVPSDTHPYTHIHTQPYTHTPIHTSTHTPIHTAGHDPPSERLSGTLNTNKRSCSLSLSCFSLHYYAPSLTILHYCAPSLRILKHGSKDPVRKGISRKKCL